MRHCQIIYTRGKGNPYEEIQTYLSCSGLMKSRLLRMAPWPEACSIAVPLRGDAVFHFRVFIIASDTGKK